MVKCLHASLMFEVALDDIHELWLQCNYSFILEGRFGSLEVKNLHSFEKFTKNGHSSLCVLSSMNSFVWSKVPPSMRTKSTLNGLNLNLILWKKKKGGCTLLQCKTFLRLRFFISNLFLSINWKTNKQKLGEIHLICSCEFLISLEKGNLQVKQRFFVDLCYYSPRELIECSGNSKMENNQNTFFLVVDVGDLSEFHLVFVCLLFNLCLERGSIWKKTKT